MNDEANEIAQRREINRLSAEAATLASQVAACYEALRRLGLGPTTVATVMLAHIPRMRDVTATMLDGLGFAAEAVRLTLCGTPDEQMQHLGRMSFIPGLTVSVRGADGNIITNPDGEQIARASATACSPFMPRPVETIIRRLLAEATSPLPDQAPAIQGGVVLIGVPMTFEGALSETPEGGLRLLSLAPGQNSNAKRIEMIEMFFGYEDVATFVRRQVVTVDAPSIIRSS